MKVLASPSEQLGVGNVNTALRELREQENTLCGLY